MTDETFEARRAYMCIVWAGSCPFYQRNDGMPMEMSRCPLCPKARRW